LSDQDNKSILTYNPESTLRFIAKEISTQVIIGHAHVRMSVLEQVSQNFTQTIALDGRQYTRLESNPEVIPNIKVNYEWNVNKFQPDRVDPTTYDSYGNIPKRNRDTFDLSQT